MNNSNEIIDPISIKNMCPLEPPKPHFGNFKGHRNCCKLCI